MPFSPAALDFLFENCSRNDRVWYQEHKDQYKSLIQTPMTQLVEDLTPTMRKIDPAIECSPKRISRVFRDARMLRGRGFFRDHVWCSFGRSRVMFGGPPSFFFEISPTAFRYGMGYYCPARETMEAMRELILRRDERFTSALQAYERQSHCRLVGESYKRDHYPDQARNIADWLNRKDICLICESTDFDLLYSSSLTERVAEDYQAIAPVYDFWLKAEAFRSDSEIIK